MQALDPEPCDRRAARRPREVETSGSERAPRLSSCFHAGALDFPCGANFGSEYFRSRSGGCDRSVHEQRGDTSRGAR